MLSIVNCCDLFDVLCLFGLLFVNCCLLCVGGSLLVVVCCLLFGVC